MKFLIVDDSEAERLLIQEFLSMRGHVAMTSDGPQAIETIKKEQPGIVLLDVGMVPLSGVDIARQIRAEGLDTCVVFISGTEREASPLLKDVDLETLGVVGFLDKAWLTKSLQRQLQDFLDSYRKRKGEEAA